MSLNKAGIKIRKGNRLGKPVALYACDGNGHLERADYASASEARKIASEMARKTGWRIDEDLSTASSGFDPSTSKIARGLAAAKAVARARPGASSMITRIREGAHKSRRD